MPTKRPTSTVKKSHSARAQRPPNEDPVEIAIEDAARHGRESEPDHEVGDLQYLVRLLAGRLTTTQLEDAMRDWAPWDADDGPDGAHVVFERGGAAAETPVAKGQARGSK
ncbi:MAG TPA: hypothetical protein VHE35_32510 [Kofleriaceae bacterium]|nr:hypothetical protein [Kofleriaceae bacterium]